MNRVEAITRAVAEIHECEDRMRAGNHTLGGPFLGYMDWVTELHRLIHGD